MTHLLRIMLPVMLLLGCGRGQMCAWEFVALDGSVINGTGTFEQIDSDNKPWAISTKHKSGKLTVFYPDGQKMQERDLVNGDLHGHYRWWYPSGILAQDVEYAGGKKHGQLQMWHENGEKHANATYVDGRENGMYREWHPNGALRSEATYANGILNGIRKQWDEKGNVIENGVFRDMQPWQGRLVIYKRVGEPPVVGTCRDGELISQEQWKPPSE